MIKEGRILFLLTFLVFGVFISNTAFSTVEHKGLIAIANWDVVPNQLVKGTLNVGVIAFHVNGISRVDFSIDDGDWIPVTKKRFNVDSNVNEFFIEIDSSKFTDESVELKAIAYPINGEAKVLDSLKLYLSEDETTINQKVYVSNSGDDTNNRGTFYSPYKKLSHALKKVNEGGEVIIMSPGRYYLDGRVTRSNKYRWVTVKGKEGLDRKDIVLSMPKRGLVRLQMDNLKFENISMDFGMIQQIYPENGESVWFHNVLWFDQNGAAFKYKKNVPPVRTSRYIKGYYVTDSIVENMTYGFVDALLVRGVLVDRISADAFQNARTVVNSKVSNIDGRTKKELHSDVFQYYGHYDNLIVYGVTGTGLKFVQNFFFDHVDSSFSNSAFVDVCIHNEEGDPPFSQLNSSHDNILFKNIITENQSWRLRDDLLNNKKFIAKNVFFLNSGIGTIKRGQYKKMGFPKGVSFIGSHAVRLKNRFYVNEKSSSCNGL